MFKFAKNNDKIMFFCFKLWENDIFDNTNMRKKQFLTIFEQNFEYFLKSIKLFWQNFNKIYIKFLAFVFLCDIKNKLF